MTMAHRNGFSKRAPGHILVDEDFVADVHAIVTSTRFGQPLPNARFDEPDKAGLVALSWDDPELDPAGVVDRIRELAPELQDRISPDHAVGMVVRHDPDDPTGASVEMGGPAEPPTPTDRQFPPRQDSDVAGRGVVVGVVDSGALGHPWLDGSFLASPGSIDPLDQDHDGKLDNQAGHGVFVTGLVLREAPAAVVRVVRAFDQDGFVYIRQAANAIVELDQLGADVINLSFGGYTRSNRPPLAHRKALSKIHDSTVVVAAAGNHKEELHARRDRKFWPAAFERVVAVAALDTVHGDPVRMAAFSNTGPWVDIAAPGAGVVSTYATFGEYTGWATWSGTSFATPMVAGRVAAAMTDGSGNKVRSAQKAKEQVMEEAADLDTRRGIAVADDVTGPIILPPETTAAALVGAQA